MAERTSAQRNRDKPYSRPAGNVKRSNSMMGWVGGFVRDMFSAPAWLLRNETDDLRQMTGESDRSSLGGTIQNPIMVDGKIITIFCVSQSDNKLLPVRSISRNSDVLGLPFLFAFSLKQFYGLES